MKRSAARAASLLIVSVLAGAGLLAGCGTTPDPAPSPTSVVEALGEGEAPTQDGVAPAEEEPAVERTTFRIASLKGPTTMGLVGLMDDAAAGRTDHDYQVTMYGTPDEVVPLIMQGEVDVALLPATLASVLHARTQPSAQDQIQVVAINTLGMLEVLEAGDTIRTVADLRGRTVYSTGRGASPEHVLNFLLTSNGLDPATDVTIEYRSEATEVAALLASEPGAIGVLPQPYVTVLQAQSPGIRSALNLTDEWAKVATGSQLVTGVVVARRAFLEENPEAFAEFLRDYEASTDFTNAEPAAAAALIAAAGIVPDASIAEAAIPASHITYVAGEEMRTVLGGYLQVLYEADPASVGGSLPGDEFYHRP